jgi:hypothetical protein
LRLAAVALNPGKLFFFDMYTIQGLAEASTQERVLADTDDLLVFARNIFSYEALTLASQYTIIQRETVNGWRRYDEAHLQRGYPMQAVRRLLEQCKLKVVRAMTTNFADVEQNPDTARVLFAVTTA